MITLIIENLKFISAPIAQWTEHHTPNVEIQVQILVGAQERSSFI